MVQVHTLVVGRLQTNCYILASKSEALVVDPGDEAPRILRYVNDLGAKLKTIVATHTHFDHVLGVSELKTQTGAPFLIHKDDLEILESMQDRVQMFLGLRVSPPPKVDDFLKDGDSVRFGDETLKVLHTPGHSLGSISLVGNGYVFTGDALFNQSIGRTDLPGGDFETLINSIKNRLFSLDDGTMVYPGHGPETSIGDEKLANPFVGRMALRVR
jgi:glyoxylase-like metal-dependent hydrolase (beta-lactamase superfamily II)